ncbi:SH3 domain-containing protein [Youngiibacter multivorans]|uniref:SH3 domain-containing protein n=1 Tax=Youngiibacter multivorans TaxID=937251 RepID=A0ABS4G095_9CLOT|nr:SH3 domain-containing protein [Youngiibacter multivorans]MBP1917968.1 hypothetical protein [Youngiibacter multivorans]
MVRKRYMLIASLALSLIFAASCANSPEPKPTDGTPTETVPSATVPSVTEPSKEIPILEPLENPGENTYDDMITEGTITTLSKHFDLDSDGTKEKIILVARDTRPDAASSEVVMYSEFELKVNELISVMKSDAMTIDLFEPRFNITDIDDTDPYREIAVSWYGEDVYSGTVFYRYDGNSLTELGQIGGFFGKWFVGGAVDDGAVKIDGSGIVRTISLSSILMPWFYDDEYSVESGKLVRIQKDIYPLEHSVTVIKDLTLRNSRTDNSDGITLKAGESCVITGSDNKEWFSIKNSSGETGWFAVDDYHMIRGTGLPAEDYFSGLINAG